MKQQTPGKLISGPELAVLIGVSGNQVRTWVREGMPIEGEPGVGGRSTKLWSAQAFRWLVARQLSPDKAHRHVGPMAPQISPKDSMGQSLEQVRLENIQADTRLKEIKLEQMRGEVASIDIIEHTLSKTGEQICAIFETIPAKIRRRNPRLNATDLQILQRELTKALNVAASIMPDLDELEQVDQELP